MKRLTIAAVAMLAMTAAGCGSKSSTPTAPSTTKVFTVQLSAANENPPITNTEKDARGTAVITIHTDTNTVDFNVSLTNFPSGSTARLAHIHGPNAPAGVNAGVLVDTGLNAGNAIAMPNGTGTFTFTGVAPNSGDIISQILASPQNFYFNVHTTLNGNGAIRGQLQ